jgi:hypothetical protein
MATSAWAVLSFNLAAHAATVAYWRFENGPADTDVIHIAGADNTFSPDILDESGNGNHLSTWNTGGCCGYAYRTDVSEGTVPQTGADNNFSIRNTGGGPGMFTQAGAPIQTISPAAWTIEVSIKPEVGAFRTYVGRDSQGAATIDQALAALYLQKTPGERLAIKFADVSGFWHEAESAENIVQGYQHPNFDQGHWYHVAAVSDGSTLSLYLNDVDAGTGYQLIAQTDMTLSGSPNTALTAGMGDGGDWDAGNWSVGRGLFNGGHTDRGYGFIDEVRISDSALSPNGFLFVPEPTSLVLWMMFGCALAPTGRRYR